MIEEEYVSFETAKLAKGKGFEEPCKYFYAEVLDKAIKGGINKINNYGKKNKRNIRLW